MFNCQILYYGKVFSITCHPNDKVEKLLITIEESEEKSQHETYDPPYEFIIEYMYNELKNQQKTFSDYGINTDSVFTILIDTRGKPAKLLGTCFECTDPLYYDKKTKTLYKCQKDDYTKIISRDTKSDGICQGPGREKFTNHKICPTCTCTLCKEIEEILELNREWPPVLEKYIKHINSCIGHLQILVINQQKRLNCRNRLKEITTIEELKELADESKGAQQKIETSYNKIILLQEERKKISQHDRFMKTIEKSNKLLLSIYFEKPYNLDTARDKEIEHNKIKDEWVKIQEESEKKDKDED